MLLHLLLYAYILLICQAYGFLFFWLLRKLGVLSIFFPIGFAIHCLLLLVALILLIRERFPYWHRHAGSFPRMLFYLLAGFPLLCSIRHAWRRPFKMLGNECGLIAISLVGALRAFYFAPADRFVIGCSIPCIALSASNIRYSFRGAPADRQRYRKAELWRVMLALMIAGAGMLRVSTFWMRQRDEILARHLIVPDFISNGDRDPGTSCVIYR
jgi:hypothetical protein